MKAKQYVLVSQGIEIHRTTDKQEALDIMYKENKEYENYREQCINNDEPYVDNEIKMFEE